MMKDWKMFKLCTSMKNKVNSYETKKVPDKPEQKKNQPVTDLYTALFPLYHISKISGSLPVKFRKVDQRYIGSTNGLSIMYGIFLVFLVMSMQCWGLWRDLKHGWQNSTRLSSETAITVTCLDVFAVFILVSAIVLGAPYRWKFLQAAMDKMVEVDKNLGIITPKKLRSVTILVTVITTIYILSISIMDYASWKYANSIKRPNPPPDKGPVNYAPIYVMYIIITTFEVQYCIFAYNIGVRFKRVNDIIEKQSKGKHLVNYFIKDLALGDDANRNEQIVAFIDSDLAYYKSKKPDSAMWPIIENSEAQKIATSIAKLITLHGYLCDSVTLLNSSYGISLIFAIVSCLIHLIITPYFLYMEVNDETFIWQTIVMQGLWCVFHVVRLLLLVQPCYQALSEVKRTGVIISQLLSSDWGPQIRKQLEIFSLQILLRPVDFSAYGLFSLDRALLASIAGAVTTYLVILIQFQTVDDEQGTKYMLKNATQLLTSVKNNVSRIQASVDKSLHTIVQD